MGPSRRLSAALLVSAVSVALAALVAAATVTGGGERRVAVEASAGGPSLEVQHAEPALSPAKRQLGEHTSILLVAVLVALVGLAATSAAVARLAQARRSPRAARRRTVRLRGPPVLQFS